MPTPVHTILLIDDNKDTRTPLVTVLEEAEYKVTLGCCAEEAMKLLRSLMPDLILLDVMMSGMNGFSFCRKLKKDPRYQDIPVYHQTFQPAGTAGQGQDSHPPARHTAGEQAAQPSGPRCQSIQE